jgi:hypothetical protein
MPPTHTVEGLDAARVIREELPEILHVRVQPVEALDGGLTFTLDARQIAVGSKLEIVTTGSSPSDVGSPVEVAWTGGGC